MPPCFFYYLLAPSLLSSLMEIGRGLYFGLLGFGLAGAAAWREVEYG